MTENNHTPQGLTLVAIDIAKDHHDVLIEPPAPARRRRLRLANRREDFEHFASYLRGFKSAVLIGFERLATIIGRWRIFCTARTLPCG